MEHLRNLNLASATQLEHITLGQEWLFPATDNIDQYFDAGNIKITADDVELRARLPRILPRSLKSFCLRLEVSHQADCNRVVFGMMNDMLLALLRCAEFAFLELRQIRLVVDEDDDWFVRDEDANSTFAELEPLAHEAQRSSVVEFEVARAKKSSSALRGTAHRYADFSVYYESSLDTAWSYRVLEQDST